MTALTKANGVWGPETIGCRNYKIKGVIAQSAPSDLLMCHNEPLPPWMEKRPTEELMGFEDFAEHEDLVNQASCQMYVKEEIALPSVLLLHGDKDNIVS